ncbi:hypothetical protein [Arthrobacter sp. NA-172]|uniref:hypothetical protein n=1 Tax=Arthrobacter sp. NA-172 TaxID=3367524 RepID=UPI00375427BF
MTTLVQGEGELLSPAMVNTGPGAADPDGSPESPGNHLPNVSVERTSEGFVLISLRPGGQISAEDGTLAREQC